MANVVEGLPAGFKRLPHRWVVEGTFAWIGRCRRLTKDWETSIKSSTAWTWVANIQILIRPEDYKVVPAGDLCSCLRRSKVSQRLSMLERFFLIA